jgi:hypothetical protein
LAFYFTIFDKLIVRRVFSGGVVTHDRKNSGYKGPQMMVKHASLNFLTLLVKTQFLEKKIVDCCFLKTDRNSSPSPLMKK